MKFIDKITIKVKAGKGGDGVVAFRRELYVPKGGPSGGDGGDGGDIIFVGNEGYNTLLDLNYRKEIIGENGENGQHKNMHGKKANAIYIQVPVGTIIYEADSKTIIGDIIENQQEVIVAKGGKGGKGNARFANSHNKAPTIFTRGDLGKEKSIICELKLLADVGIVGLPNAGKSTLLATLSHAKPQIADFPFTTLTPQLGVVKYQDFSFVLADLPGLIEGASLGKGLGYEFLRHIERCRLLIHLIDMSNADAFKNYEIIQKELLNYNLSLEKKVQIVVASKMDDENAEFNYENFIKKIKIKVISISSWSKKGLQELLATIKQNLEKITKNPSVIEIEDELKIYQLLSEIQDIKVENLGNGQWKVSGDTIYRIYHKFPLTTHDNILIFNKKLRELGVYKTLIKKGIKKGDIVKIFNYELQWENE